MPKLPSFKRVALTIGPTLGLLFSLPRISFAACVDIGITCLNTDPAGLASDILGLGIGLGTLLALLFLVIGGLGVATSGGNPENLEQAKSQITAAITGLVFILMSVLILSIIGEGVIGIDFFK